MSVSSVSVAGLTWTEAVARRAEVEPEGVAIRFRGVSITWSDLYARARAFAQALASRGVAAGDRVIVLMRNRPQVPEALLGIHLAGAVAVPLNFRLSYDEILVLVDDCSAVAIVGDAELLAPVLSAVEQRLVTWTVEDDTLSIMGSPSGLEDARDRRDDGEPIAADVAFILYTSGTTGFPKGAMITYGNLVAAAINFMYSFLTDSRDVYYLIQPVFHIGGLMGLIGQSFVGGTVVLAPSGDFRPEEFVRVVVDERATTSVMVPTMASAICELDPADLRGVSLRQLMWGAAPATTELLERLGRVLPGTGIVSSFGQTESTGLTFRLPAELALSHLGSVGGPMPMLAARIVDPSGVLVRRGDVGEIQYRGPQVFAGYFRNPQATLATFDGEWLKSGDLVRQGDSGHLYVVDRVKDMIISGGENIYSAEVENALASHPDVRAVAVVGAPHPRWGETPIAFVVPEPGRAPTERALIEYCVSRIASYKKPTGVRLVDALPRNASGKVLKQEIRTWV